MPIHRSDVSGELIQKLNEMIDYNSKEIER